MSDIYWIGANSGQLDDPGNWDLGRLPSGSDHVIVSADSYTYAPGDDPSPGAVAAASVTVTGAGTIVGGSWDGSVAVTANAGLGDAGSSYQPTFHGAVTIGTLSSGNAVIYRGVFNAAVDCYGQIFGGTFNDLLRLLGTHWYMRSLYGLVLADRLQIGSGPVLYAGTSSRVALPSQVKSGISNCGSVGSYVGMVLARAQLGM
jgi:hypothetical protein